MNPNPFRHWVFRPGSLHLLSREVQDLAGVDLAQYDIEHWRLGSGEHRPLNTQSNLAPRGWRCFTAIVFCNAHWDPSWGGHLELWAEYDQAPSISYLPVYNRTILLEYGDRHWWGFPVPVRGPDPLRIDVINYWSSVPPEGSSAPHGGFSHPKGALLQ